MKKNSEIQWRRTSPLAAIFYLGKIYKDIAKNATQTFAPLIVLLVAVRGDMDAKITIGIAAFLAVTVISAFVRYWCFRYLVTDNSILIREGVFSKTQLDIKFAAIQAINTTQNFVFRLFNLVTVKFDTAGSAKQEGNLPAIKLELADSLKARIRTERREEIVNDGRDSALPPTSGVLLRLNNMDMMRIGLSSGRVLLVLALLGPFVENLDQQIDRYLRQSEILATFKNAGMSIAGNTGIIIGVLILVMVLLAAVSIASSFLRYYKFELRSEADTLRSAAGLMTRHEHSINLAKIQSLRATQNLALRIFQRYRVLAKQASSGKPGSGKQFVVPLGSEAQVARLSSIVFGDEFPDASLDPRSALFQAIDRRYIRSRFLIFGVLPVVALTLLELLTKGESTLVYFAWLPIYALVVLVRHRKYGFKTTDDGIILRKGFLGYQTVAFLHRKVQRISVTQTLPQERKGLAPIRFYLASGWCTLPYVNVRMANQLRDYILYKVESRAERKSFNTINEQTQADSSAV